MMRSRRLFLRWNLAMAGGVIAANKIAARPVLPLRLIPGDPGRGVMKAGHVEAISKGGTVLASFPVRAESGSIVGDGVIVMSGIAVAFRWHLPDGRVVRVPLDSPSRPGVVGGNLHAQIRILSGHDTFRWTDATR